MKFANNKTLNTNNVFMKNNLNNYDHFSTKINSKNDNTLNLGRKNSLEMPIENSLFESNTNFQGNLIFLIE